MNKRKKRKIQNFSNDPLANYLLNNNNIDFNFSEIQIIQSCLNDSIVKLWILFNSS